MQNESSLSVVGWGIDGSEENRPGVPAEYNPPRPVGNAHWIEPDPQPEVSPKLKPLVGPNRFLTRVYSTANPPRGLSGALRRVAYRIPDYKARRWMLLILADRIDVLEHNVAPVARLAGGIGLVALGVLAFRALRRA